MWAEIDGNSVNLYGTIWQGDGPYIVSSLKKLLAQKDPITINVHSPGGSVIDGNLIRNAIAKSKNDLTLVNVGLSASMMAIILVGSGKKVKMASNGFLMIHPPSGSTSGGAKDFENTAKLLRDMESTFVKQLMAKTGKTEAEAREWMIGDNWFNAEEALEAGLIDEIIDPILEDAGELAAYQDLKLCAQLFEKYDQRPETQPPTQKVTNNSNQSNSDMKLSAEALKALGLDANASEQEINAAIAAKDQKIKELEAKDAQGKKARAEKLVNDAVAAGKILGSEKEQWMKDAEANLDLTERMIAKLQGKKNLGGSETPESTPSADGREKWSFDDWRKKDVKGLIALKSSDPEKYKALTDQAGIKIK